LRGGEGQQSNIAIGLSASASWSPTTVESISCITLKASTLNVPVTIGFLEYCSPT
jgi:hypothetical protein